MVIQPPSCLPPPPQHKIINYFYLCKIGSPFGILSPTAFFNCLAQGVISNMIPSSTSPSKTYPLLLTDARVLPGMEGGPAVDEKGHWLGVRSFFLILYLWLNFFPFLRKILMPPLYKSGGSPVELNMILTVDALLPLLRSYLTSSPSSPRLSVRYLHCGTLSKLTLRHTRRLPTYHTKNNPLTPTTTYNGE